jgi:preprotein translocase subunit Sec61beta
MSKKKYQLPPTMGGLVRYHEEEETLFNINPKVVLGIIIAIIFLEILLKFRIFL